MAFSSPYISSATRSNCITVSIKQNETIVFLDFKIDILLERLNLIELHKPFHTATKFFLYLSWFFNDWIINFYNFILFI